MTSDDIHEVYGIQDESSFNGYYILLTILKRVNGQNSFLKNTIVVDLKARAHRQVWDNFHQQHWPKSAWGEGWRKTATGGGFISLKLDTKRIEIYGESELYGKVDHQLVAEILRKNFPHYVITVL